MDLLRAPTDGSLYEVVCAYHPVPVSAPIRASSPSTGWEPDALPLASLGPSAGLARRRALSLAEFWRALVTGKLRVVSTFKRDGNVHALATECAMAPLAARERTLLERAFLGEAQKSLAAELGVSATTASVLMGRALARLGVPRRIFQAPLPVALGAMHHQGALEPPAGAHAEWADGTSSHEIVITIPEFNPARLPSLTEAERQVAHLFAEGLCQKAIAAQRGTSLRTVANQIASLSRKLDVCGRFALIRRWAELEGWSVMPIGRGLSVRGQRATDGNGGASFAPD